MVHCKLKFTKEVHIKDNCTHTDDTHVSLTFFVSGVPPLVCVKAESIRVCNVCRMP